MKTNVIMESSDRNLFGVVIRQETKTGFLNLSDLQTAFESVRTQKGWTKKIIPELLLRSENVERIFYILQKQDVINISLSDFNELVKQKGVTTVLKSFDVYKTTGARDTKTSWCNPYIWILLALELSPEFYANTVLWLTDKLILNRIEAGNLYKGLTDAIRRFNLTDKEYIHVAKALNYIVFGKHEPGIRNNANSKQLKELETLEQNVAYLVNEGFLKSIYEVIEHLRKKYKDKYLNNLQLTD